MEQKPKNTKIFLHIDDETRELLDKACEIEDRPMSSFARVAIRQKALKVIEHERE